ncbi:hypothetical protein [Polymorphobacter megasporae]|uniref:hypothetical protein n=1 Tax=Glacieibacterium megasporae TaxID=2835787 RepID=UPI001C1DD82E|nr:hypothetical protein [Polymorphobacter megasporae]UAJ10684.1 hypothetical protein KTC28_02745 [Polymorphobacter megasporae]
MITRNYEQLDRSLGPHLVPPTNTSCRRSAVLDEVAATANYAISGTLLEKFGPLTLAVSREEPDFSYFGQIKSKPLSAFGDCEFRFDIPAGDSEAYGTHPLVEALLTELGAFHRARPAVRKRAAAARKLAEKLLSRASNGRSDIRLLAIGLKTVGDDDFSIIADVRTLGYDLQLGVDRIRSRNLADFETDLAAMVDVHLLREREFASAEAAGVSYWIDEAALLILDASGFSRAEVFAEMRDRRVMEFYFGGDAGWDLSAALYWENGTLVGDVENRRDGWRLEADVFTLKGACFPETVISTLIGRRMRDVIDFPFVPREAIITDLPDWSEGWLYLKLANGKRGVNVDGDVQEPS